MSYRVSSIKTIDGYRHVTVDFAGTNGEPNIQRTWRVGKSVTLLEMVSYSCYISHIEAEYEDDNTDFVILSNGMQISWASILRDEAEIEANEVGDSLEFIQESS